MIKVLITEDSPVIRRYLAEVLSADPEIEVIGTARNGKEAVALALINPPDVITMDIHMPHMDGYAATREIMENNPVPVVIVSASYNPDEVEKTFKSMEAGAVAALGKPSGFGHPQADQSVRELIHTVKTMAGVQLVRRWSKRKQVRSKKPSSDRPVSNGNTELVVIGASTGGPMVLGAILSRLPANFPVPVVIVQHIAPGFLPGLCQWLSEKTELKVKVAREKEKVLPGTVYLAPDAKHLEIDRNLNIELLENRMNTLLCPAVSHLFQSAALNIGDSAIGVLLTGMGKDGARELGMMKEAGAVTIVQDEESSVVYGMPGEAVRLNAHSHILHADAIADKLKELLYSKKSV